MQIQKNRTLQGKHNKPIVADFFIVKTHSQSQSLSFVMATKDLKIGAHGI